MADYYAQFSTRLEKLNAEEAEWLRDQLDRDFEEDERPTWLDEADDAPGFEWDLFEDTLGLWTMNGSATDLHSATELVREFLERFRPNSYWSIQYATTCSRPKLDAFGGGVAFVTAAEVEFHDGGNWLSQRIESFESRPSSPSKNSGNIPT